MTVPSSQQYVAYLIVPRQTNATMFVQHALQAQEQRIQHFLNTHPQSTLLNRFIESGECKKPSRQPWPELEKAISYCLEHHAHLLIAEIRNLTHNSAFTEQIHRLIEQQTGDIYCCDQPFIEKTNFSVLTEYAKQQRTLHGQRIKAGLKLTQAKSGNPHAQEVINKVNKPKIDNAIAFALMLQPIITHYQACGYSQRKMVCALNEAHFTAPEGGLWVLSQLQKVLERIQWNEVALSIEKQLQAYEQLHYDNATMAIQLNKAEILCPKEKVWTEETVEKIKAKIQHLHDIIALNELIIELVPMLEKYHIDELSEAVFTDALQQSGIHSEYEESPKELLKRIIASLESIQQLDECFLKNPQYIPHFLHVAQQSQVLTEYHLAHIKLIEALAPCAKKFLTPSYQLENRHSENTKLNLSK